jgi:DnaJ family protein C protein 13
MALFNLVWVPNCLVVCRVGLVEVLLGILDWRAGGRNGLCSQMKWNENEASVGRVLAVEVRFATLITGL